MRLIDGEKLVDMLYDNEFASLCPLDEVSGVIDACPTINAEVVVRCKDCRYFKMYKCRMRYSNHDDFCSYGERKG